MEDRTTRVLVIEDNPADAVLVSHMLETLPGHQFEIVCAGNLKDGLQYLTDGRFDLALLDLRLPDSEGMDTFLAVHRQMPTVPIVVLTGIYDEALAVRAVESGAQDYLVKGQVTGEDLVRSIRYSMVRASVQEKMLHERELADRGRVIGFIGAKGGVGTTTTAVNLTSSLIRRGKSGIMLELRNSYGTLAPQIGTTPMSNLSHLCGLTPKEINEKQLNAKLSAVSSGLRALYSPQKVDEFVNMQPDQIKAIIEGLAVMADYVLVDLCSYPSAENQVAVQHCNMLLLVVTPDLPCVCAGKVYLRLLETWGVGYSRIGAVIVNHVGLVSTGGMMMQDVSSELGCRIIGVIPPISEENILAARKRGMPVVEYQPDSMIASNLADIAQRITTDNIVSTNL
jgi:Flp pilus assembly CpaE family ATPase